MKSTLYSKILVEVKLDTKIMSWVELKKYIDYNAKY